MTIYAVGRGAFLMPAAICNSWLVGFYIYFKVVMRWLLVLLRYSLMGFLFFARKYLLPCKRNLLYTYLHTGENPFFLRGAENPFI